VSKLTGIELLLRMGVLLVVVGAIMTIVPLMTWVERRGMAIMQDRMGPNRVGPFGILQPLADGVKFMFKESIVLPNVDRSLYFLAPVLAMIPALVAFSVIPFGGDLHIGSYVIPLQVSNAQAGILILLAIGSLGVYGTLVAGWSSNNKFAVLGALRAASQMISYEAVMGLSLVSILLIYGTTELSSIVQMQSSGWEGPVPKWGLFMQPVSALLFLVTIFAETNRLPFDLPEGESELVAGYHTEYGGLKFASFMLAEYIHMITLSALVVTLFFGWIPLSLAGGHCSGELIGKCADVCTSPHSGLHFLCESLSHALLFYMDSIYASTLSLRSVDDARLDLFIAHRDFEFTRDGNGSLLVNKRLTEIFLC